VEKDYPNVLKVTIKERREIYAVESDGEFYVVNEDGFVLSKITKEKASNDRSLIELKLVGVEFSEVEEGSVIKISGEGNEELLPTVFEMAKSARLTDCTKRITIKKLASSEPSDVEFLTYTGVTICVQKAEIDGVEKVEAAFRVYDDKVSDYEKAFDVLYAFRNAETGQIQVTWSDGTVVKP
jgi:hypothetical protein